METFSSSVSQILDVWEAFANHHMIQIWLAGDARRFPLMHDLDSPFSIKHLFLLARKLRDVVITAVTGATKGTQKAEIVLQQASGRDRLVVQWQYLTFPRFWVQSQECPIQPKAVGVGLT